MSDMIRFSSEDGRRIEDRGDNDGGFAQSARQWTTRTREDGQTVLVDGDGNDRGFVPTMSKDAEGFIDHGPRENRTSPILPAVEPTPTPESAVKTFTIPDPERDAAFAIVNEALRSGLCDIIIRAGNHPSGGMIAHSVRVVAMTSPTNGPNLTIENTDVVFGGIADAER